MKLSLLPSLFSLLLCLALVVLYFIIAINSYTPTIGYYLALLGFGVLIFLLVKFTVKDIRNEFRD